MSLDPCAGVQVGDSYIYLGNQWNSGLQQSPPGPRNHDLLYWGELHFEAAPDGGPDRVGQLVWHDEIHVTVPSLHDELSTTRGS